MDISWRTLFDWLFVVSPQQQPLGCVSLYVDVVIDGCMKILQNLHKFDDVMNGMAALDG